MNGKKILIVEDHPDCRELLGIILGRSGYTIVTAGTGLEAIDRARTTGPDLILMDFGLPDMMGDQIIARLKTHSSTEAIPVIVTTGYIDPKVADRARAAGAAKVMVKPFDLSVLMDAMDFYLSTEPDHPPLSLEQIGQLIPRSIGDGRTF